MSRLRESCISLEKSLGLLLAELKKAEEGKEEAEEEGEKEKDGEDDGEGAAGSSKDP